MREGARKREDGGLGEWRKQREKGRRGQRRRRIERREEADQKGGIKSGI